MSDQSAGHEIERKFILRELPPHFRARGIRVEQGYLSSPGDEREVRLRRLGSRRFLTVKTGTGLVRGEREVRIGRASFDALWPLTEGARVSKTRYTVHDHGVTVEVDVYSGGLEPLITAEIEIPPGVGAATVAIPQWLGTEVTGMPGFSNGELARRGLPDEFEELRPAENERAARPLSHAGAVPYRVSNGRIEVLCITSTSGKRWIVPKGIWEDGETLSSTASMEAWEEAGVTGNLGRVPLGIMRDDRNGRRQTILVYALAVIGEEKSWPESNVRRRRWCSLQTAMELVDSPGLAFLISELPGRIPLDTTSRR